jgi:DnaJ-class molecular chaperone
MQAITLEDIKRWRAARYAAGEASSLEDFYTVNRICRSCQGRGFVGVGYFLKYPDARRCTCSACGGNGRTKPQE